MKPIVANRHMNARWQKALDLCLSSKYPTDEEIKSIGISRATYFRWKATPEFQKDCSDMASKQFFNLTGRAVKKLEELLESEDERIVIKAAQMVLDKTIKGVVEEKQDDSTLKMTVEYVDVPQESEVEYEVQ